jgi:hypothetical protein
MHPIGMRGVMHLLSGCAWQAAGAGNVSIWALREDEYGLA